MSEQLGGACASLINLTFVCWQDRRQLKGCQRVHRNNCYLNSLSNSCTAHLCASQVPANLWNSIAQKCCPQPTTCRTANSMHCIALHCIACCNSIIQPQHDCLKCSTACTACMGHSDTLQHCNLAEGSPAMPQQTQEQLLPQSSPCRRQAARQCVPAVHHILTATPFASTCRSGGPANAATCWADALNA